MEEDALYRNDIPQNTSVHGEHDYRKVLPDIFSSHWYKAFVFLQNMLILYGACTYYHTAELHFSYDAQHGLLI